MIQVTIGDRVESSNLLGTIVSISNEYNQNLNSNHLNENVSGDNRNQLENLNNHYSDGHTFVVEWDDLSKGEFDNNSNRLNKIKNTQTAILNHLNTLNNRNNDNSTLSYNSEVYNIINRRFSIIDSYKPCSYVKLTDISTGTSFEEQFRSKYLCDRKNVNTIHMENSDRIYEFVGIDSAFDFFSDAKKLVIVDLNGMSISTIGEVTQFPKCSDLYLNDNLLDSSKINELLKNFPTLKVLNVSYNKVDSRIESSSLITLVMNGCYLDFRTVLKTLNKSKNILNLIMCNNLLNEIEYLGTHYPMVKSIDLSSNFIYKWETINILLQIFPNLSRISLDNNYISSVECPDGSTFLNLLDLDLSNNLLENVNDLVKISQIFPNLSKLKLNFNPINLMSALHTDGSVDSKFNGLITRLNNIKSDSVNNSSSSLEMIRMFAIITFPNLTVLNGTSISVLERTNSERYLNRQSTKSEPTTTHTVQPTNKIRVTLIPDGDSDSFSYKPVQKSLMESYTVSDLKLLCSSLFKMNLKDIKLVYNNKMMPLCEELDDDSADLGSYGISDGYEIRVQNKQLSI